MSEPTSRVATRRAPTAEGVEAAAAVIDPVFTKTPQFVSEALAERLGVRLLCKVETLNPIGSFKGRGTDLLLHELVSAGGSASEVLELVCGSAGNFGQGLAYAARRHGVRATVFAAENANPLKVQRMRELGARVELAGRDFDSAKEAAREYAARTGSRFIEDGREPAISEGAGTIALELARWPHPIDAVLVPLGNGALAAGIGTWLAARNPDVRVIAVCAARAPAMERSWRAGRPVSTSQADTIADGIAVREPVPEAVADLQPLLHEVLLVGEESILAAMRMVFETLGTVVEPAGAVGVAAALEYRGRFEGALVATPLCGRNLTPAQVALWLGNGNR